MEREKIEQWITKREIQKHSPKKKKQYKSPKTFSVNLIDSLNKTIDSAQILLDVLNKIK